MAFSFFRELGPLMAGIMVAARGGAGMGAELGSMRVTHQIDALTVSAVNPMKYLVVTRIVACMLVLPLLTVAANLIGILGGMIIGVTQVGMTPTYYYTLTVKYLTLKDVLPGIGKTSIFGLIIGTVGCYHGYNTEHGTFGVGQATKTSVVAVHPADPDCRCLSHQTHHPPLALRGRSAARVTPEPGVPLISFRGIHKSFGDNVGA